MTMSEFTPEQIRQVLDLDLGPNDSGEATVRGYLLRLLHDVWTQGEGFDGKRPFGNSSWEYELYKPIVAAGLVGGRIDADGYLETVDDKAVDALILAAIAALDAPREVTGVSGDRKLTVTITPDGMFRDIAIDGHSIAYAVRVDSAQLSIGAGHTPALVIAFAPDEIIVKADSD